MKRIYTTLVMLSAILAGSNRSALAQSSTFVYTPSVIQTYTVPPGVTTLSITATGAAGGNSTGPVVVYSGGHGAIVTGTVTVVPGHVLSVLVGGLGATASRNAGGGGGSFVWDASAPATPLIVAGGGGGACSSGAGIAASLTTSGTDGGAGAIYGGHGSGGTGGVTPGGGLPALSCGAGGCGWVSNGAGGMSIPPTPPLAMGGDSPNPTVTPGTGAGGAFGGSAAFAGSGGFGGGGGGEAPAVITTTGSSGGGGGGGYSGGGGGASPTLAEAGGGGGLYCSGAILSSSVSTAIGNGQVIITPICGPGAITGNAPLCVGSTEALNDTPSGGTWVSVNTTIATIDGSGNVTGLAPGTDTIYYIVLSDCGTVDTVVATLAVNASSSAGIISGSLTLCVGTSTTLMETLSGGTWSASNTNASITAGGLVTGVAVGTDIITYTNSCGLATTTAVVTINPAPTAGTITGSVFTVCAGSTITLADAASGGTWSSSNTAVATDGGGTVYGVSGGTATIVYTVSGPCGTVTATQAITVNPLPSAGTITGTISVCAGAAPFTLGDAVAGGTWSSSNTAVATITVGPPGGVVTPVSAGTTTITYSVSNSCGTSTTTQVITINPPPSAGSISGPSTVCMGGAPITLTDAVTGGTWSASNTNATVAGGTVTAVATGTDTIKYTVTNGCGANTATLLVSIDTVPTTAGTITGIDSLCTGTGHTVTLTDLTTGGVWSCSNTKATVAGGVVTGVAAGMDTVIYTVSNACGSISATFPIKVKTCPSEVNTITNPANDLAIYPNPASDELTIMMDEGSFSSFTITNSLGQVLIRDQQLNGSKTSVNIRSLPSSAIYYITFKGQSGTSVKRFVKM